MMSAGVLVTMLCPGRGSDTASEPRATGKTFLLVDGAWMGAWCWADVTKALRVEEGRALALTLTRQSCTTCNRTSKC